MKSGKKVAYWPKSLIGPNSSFHGIFCYTQIPLYPWQNGMKEGIYYHFQRSILFHYIFHRWNLDVLPSKPLFRSWPGKEERRKKKLLQILVLSKQTFQNSADFGTNSTTLLPQKTAFFPYYGTKRLSIVLCKLFWNVHYQCFVTMLFCSFCHFCH